MLYTRREVRLALAFVRRMIARGWHLEDGNPGKIWCDENEKGVLSAFRTRSISEAARIYWLLHYSTVDPYEPVYREFRSWVESELQ